MYCENHIRKYVNSLSSCEIYVPDVNDLLTHRWICVYLNIYFVP